MDHEINNTAINDMSFRDSTHKWGKIWGFSMLGIIVMFPVMLMIIFGEMPDWRALGLGLIAVIPNYWATAVVEVFTFVPMLGAGGAYLSFVTGNISNLKLPCALNALENANVKAQSEEGEVVSTIAIAMSSIVTTVIIIIGVILIIPLSNLINSYPGFQPAFDQLLPALFGALGVVFISKNWKIAIAPITLMLILFVFVPAIDTTTVGIMVPVGVLFTIAVSWILYKKKVL